MHNLSNKTPRAGGKPEFSQISAIAALVAASLLVGCEEPGIQSYSIPAESRSSASPTAPLVSWVTPEGWVEMASGSAMRYATFAIKGLHGHNVDVSITPLPAMQGGELENVNRWRGQVGLDPIDQEELDKQAEKVLIGGEEARLFDMTSKEATVHGEHYQRILAVTHSMPGKIWFFKMMGVAETVGEQKEAFQAFLKSIAIEESEAPAMPPSMMGMMGSPHGRGSAAPPPPSQGQPDWDVPEGWTAAEGSSMRIATFQVGGEDSGFAEIAVTKFPGSVGTLQGNIDRWRGQAGLGPIQPDQVDRYSRKLDWEGVDATLVDTSGVKEGERDAATQRLITVIVNKDGFKWFYKMSGSSELVGQQEEKLIQFAKSAQ